MVNTENAEVEEEFDAIVERAKIAERREQEKKRTRRKREKIRAPLNPHHPRVKKKIKRKVKNWERPGNRMP